MDNSKKNIFNEMFYKKYFCMMIHEIVHQKYFYRKNFFDTRGMTMKIKNGLPRFLLILLFEDDEFVTDKVPGKAKRASDRCSGKAPLIARHAAYRMDRLEDVG